MWSEQTGRARALRIAVILGALLFLAAACGFTRDGIERAKAGNDSLQLTDGISADTDLTDSDFTDSAFTDLSSDFTDLTDSTDTDSTAEAPPADPTPLIPLVVDPPGLPSTPPAPGPPDREEPGPDGTQKPVTGTYTYDNLDDFLFGDWGCLKCDTDVPSFRGAVDKLGRTLDGHFASVSVARFGNPTDAGRSLRQVTADRVEDTGGVWEEQLPSVPGIPGASGSLTGVKPSGQDYEVRFVVKDDLFIIDFAVDGSNEVDQDAANAFARVQYQKALTG